MSGITVDGKISTDEYNGAAKITLDEKNLKAGVVGEKIAEGFSADVYFGWDAKYLYVAYDITDGTNVTSPSIHGTAVITFSFFLMSKRS